LSTRSLARSKPGHVRRNPRQTQERILLAALGEFANQGFAGARVDVIARRARINKRMLYHYFGNKEGLFREVLRRKIQERAEWMAAAPDDPIDSLPYWFELACGDPDWVRLLEWEALQRKNHEVIDEAHRREAFARSVARVKRRQAEGFLAPHFDPAQLLLSMMALAAYPLAFPQLARLVTGHSVSDPKFQKQRAAFLRQFAAAFRGKSSGASAAAQAAKGEEP
jgi:AcrR family transcriptional regulator